MIDGKKRWTAAAARCALACCVSIGLGGCQSKGARSPTPAVPEAATVSVKLIAFNDFHGHINPPRSPTRVPDPASAGKTLDLPTGGVQYLSTLITQLKSQNELHAVVAAGDLISGAPLVSSLFHQEPAIELLNQLGLEFTSVGNHEFDNGRSELLRIQNGGCFPGGTADTCQRGRFAGAKFKYLAANVIDASSGAPLLPGFAVKKFTASSGVSFDIGFIGLVLKDTPTMVIPEGVKGLQFSDEAASANALVPQLRAQGIESIVVLIHQGGYTTARSFDDATCPGFTGAILGIMDRLDPAIDVVVSGHTHRAYTCRHGGRLVTSAGSEGRFLTDIDLQIDPGTRNIVHAQARQLAVVNDTAPNPLPDRYPTLAKDARLSGIVDFYNLASAPLALREVGRISGDIPRASNAAGESPLGDLVADAQLAATRAAGAQIAFMNRDGIRADLRQGDGKVSYSDVFSIHPFGNSLVTMTLTGAQIHALLEQQWSGANGVLQVSEGFSYQWDASAPVGARVVVGSVHLHDVPIDPSAAYRVTVNEFMAQGGDNFSVLSQGTDRVRSGVDAQALEQFLTASGTVSPPPATRIRRLR